MNELKRFIGYLRGYTRHMALAVILVLAVTLLALPYPMIMRSMLDDALPHKSWPKVEFLMLIFVGCFLMRGVLGYTSRFVLQRMGMRITCDLRKEVFAHLQTLSIKFYENRHTGKIVARVTEDTGAVFNLITSVLVNLITDSLTVIAFAVMLFWINWQLAIPALAVIPFFVVNYRVSKRKLRKLSRRHRRNWDRVVGFLHERVSSSRLVKSFSMEEREINEFNRGIESDFRNYNQLNLYNTRLLVAAEMISSLGVLIVLALGGWFVIHDKMSIGNLIAFNTYLGLLFTPIVRLNDLNALVERAITALEKIHDLLDTPSFVTEKPDALMLPPVKGRITFKNVQFSYNAGQRTLRDIQLDVEQGQMIALVGPSGSGKTTLINLLCRFYDIDSGEILIDGTDIRKVTVKSLRRQIGVVAQENLLFSGSLIDNIRYGNPDASMEAIEQATRAAHAHDFIQEMPRGYNTVVGERGTKLSGGQRQRIAIARAILKNPGILVFDEATSALDSESEHAIQQAMEGLIRGRTSFVIAHRLSTVLKADKIVVLQDGRIVEQGRHAELLNHPGLYRRLYELQFRDLAKFQESRPATAVA